jgi:arabinose-5-phosphate isomerase
MLTQIKDVLKAEISGLESLLSSVDGSLADVITNISSCSGVIIFCGIGKSALIASKTSALLNSFGVRSATLDPIASMHGDIGFVSHNDCIILLSNSGESRELDGIVQYAKQYNIKTVAITRVSRSTLARSCDHVISIPNNPEAFAPFNPPTTSSIMMMAIGDCIAVSIATLRGFNLEQYSKYHPAGSLGLSMIKVSDFISSRPHANLACIDINATSIEMLEVISRQDSNGVLAVINQNGSLVGCITDGDVRRALLSGSGQLPQSIMRIMSKDPKFVLGHSILKDCVEQMNTFRINAVFVCSQDQKPIGLITRHDLLQWIKL